MPEKIKNWTLGSDAEGNVRLHIHIGGKHYTLDVHEKDVQSMQNTLDVKAIMAQAEIPEDTKRMRVVIPITGGIQTLAETGEVLTITRDYFRIGQPRILQNKYKQYICDVNSHTAKTQCLAID